VDIWKDVGLDEFISLIDAELELDNRVEFQMGRWKDYEISWKCLILTKKIMIIPNIWLV
jgi:hypothetical protein